MRRLALILFIVLIAGVALAGGHRGSLFNSSNEIDRYNFNRNGAVDPAGATTEVYFDRVVAGTYAAEVGAQTFTVNGTPVLRHDGTYPDGTEGYAWRFAGSEYLTSSVGPPTGDFTASIVITPRSVTGLQYWIGNFSTTGSKRGWVVYSSGTSVACYISNNGSTGATMSNPSMLAINRPAHITFQYTASGDGTSVGRLCVDEHTCLTNSTMPSIYSGADGLSIGAGGDAANPVTGDISHASYWSDRRLSDADVIKRRRQWWGVMSSSGATLDPTPTSGTLPAMQISPEDSGTEPFIVDLPYETVRTISPESGVIGLGTEQARTSWWRNGSYESCTANGSTEPDYYTVTETAGTGTADLSCNTSTMAHGFNSVEMALTGSDSAIELEQDSACRTDNAGAFVHLETWAKKLSGTSNVYIGARTFTDAACSVGEADIYLTTANSIDVPTDWTLYEGEIDLTGKGSWYPVIVSYHSESTVVFDVGVAVDTGVNWELPLVGYPLCNTDADCSTVSTLVKITYWPLQTTEFAYTVRLWTPYAVGDLGALADNVYCSVLNDGDPGVDNATSLQMDYGRSSLRCTVHEDAANLRWNTGGGWTGQVMHEATCGHYNTLPLGEVLYILDGTSHANSDGAGTKSSMMDGYGRAHGWVASEGSVAHPAIHESIVFKRRP